MDIGYVTCVMSMSMKGFRWIYMWFMWSILSEVKHVVSTGSAKTQGISCYPHGTGPSFWGGWELIQKPKKARTKLWHFWVDDFPNFPQGGRWFFVPWRVFFFQTSNLLNLSFLLCCSFRPFHPFILFGLRFRSVGKKTIETLEQYW